MTTTRGTDVLGDPWIKEKQLPGLFLCADAQQPTTIAACRLWVIRDRVEPAARPAMSAMPPKAEINSGH
jgi:hypothetical protein